MKLHSCFIGMTLAACLALAATANAQETPGLDEAFERAATWTQGESRLPLAVIEREVQRRSGESVAEAALEARLLHMIERDDASDEARLFACRQLALVGSVPSVPILAGLLGSERLSDAARLALQAIPDSEAGLALAVALDDLTGEALVGAVGSLGARRDPASAVALDELLTREEAGSPAWRAAVAALVQIGGPAALERLGAHRTVVLRRASGGDAVALEALIAMADAPAAQGRTDDARELYRMALDAAGHGRKEQRIAVLDHWLQHDPAGALPHLTVWRGGDDDATRGATVRLLAAAGGADTTALLTEHLMEIADRNGSPAVQADIIRALAGRGDLAAAPAIAMLADAPSAEVADAAALALGTLGSAAHAPLLATRAAAGSAAAAESLRRMHGPGVDRVMVHALAGQPAPARLEMARALGERGSLRANDALLRATRDETNDVVRAALLQALGRSVGAVELPRFAALVVAEESPAVVETADDAYVIAGTRLGAESAVRELMYAPRRQAAADDPRRIRLMGRLGGETAGMVVAEALEREDEEVADAAMAALAAWPDGTQAEPLLELARTATGPRRAIAFAGLVRALGMPGDRETAETIGLCGEALAVARDAGERRMVLETVGRVPDPAALELARGSLADRETARAAAGALVEIAANLDASHADAARSAIGAALTRFPDDPTLRERAGAAISRLEREEGFIRAWVMAGPFRREKLGGGALYDVAFAPESGRADEVDWRPVPAEAMSRPGIVDLQRAIGGNDACAYLAVVIRSDRAQAARLEIGSDDGVRVWINGREVHGNNVMRGLTVGQDVAEVELDRGRNVLLMKITQGGGDWRGCCRLRGPDGFRLEGVTVEPLG